MLHFNNEKRIDFFVPNEIIPDFRIIEYKTNSHYAFLVAYYILISFLFYRCSYAREKILISDIKRVLGLNENNKSIDYLIRNKGLLDKLGYTISTNNYAVSKEYINDLSIFKFNYVNDYKNVKFLGKSHNYKVKYPVKGFYRDTLNKNEENGTFFNVKNTIKIDMNTFYEIIHDEELGVIGFLIYLNFKKLKRLRIGYKKLSETLLISERCIKKKIKTLEQDGYIYVEHAKYDYKNNKTNANTYRVY